MRARERRDRRRRASCSPDVDDVGGRGPGAARSTSSWSGPRRRSSPGSATRCAEAGIRCFGPSARGGAARGLEGVLPRRSWRPPACPTAGLHRRCRRRGRACAAIDRYPVVHQGRRPGRGQGRGHRRGRAGGAGGARGAARRAPLRHRARRGRGAPRGRGALAARALRRRACGPARLRPGLQAHRRRRPRAQHRRHGLVLAGAGDRRGASAGDLRRRPPAGARRAAPAAARRSTACSTPG